MQIVLITPKEYKDVIKFNAQEESATFRNITFENSQKNKEDKLTIIDSKEAFEKISFDGVFNTGDYGERQVLIVPELGWFDDTDDVEQGYKCALELLRERYKKPFLLRFISIFTQPQLLSMVGNDYKSLVESFPHYCLLDELKSLAPRVYSSKHFDLIKNIFISHKGYLSFLLHNVQNEPGDDFESYKKIATSTLERLSISPFANFHAKIEQLKKDVETIEINNEDEDINANSLKTIWDNVKGLIMEIRSSLRNNNDEYTLDENHRILIVEDEKDQRKRLYEFFSKRFKHVWCNDIQETLSNDELEDWETKNSDEEKYCYIKEFKIKDRPEKWIEKHANQVDVVFLDLLYKDDSGTLLSYSGIDFFHQFMSANSYCVIKVITSLPRNEISIVDKEISSHVLTKRGGWDMLEGCLADRMEEIVKECDDNKKRYEENEHAPGPKNGFFDSELVKRLIIQWRNEPYCGMDAEEFDDENKETVLEHYFKMADDYIASVRRGEKKLETYGNKVTPGNITKEEVQKYFYKVLANRKLALEYIANNGKGNKIDVNQYKTTNRMGATADRGYFYKIGFSTKKVTDVAFRVDLNANNDLFVEEKRYYDNLLQFENDDSIIWIYEFVNFCKSLNLPDDIKGILNTPVNNMTPIQILKLLQFIFNDKSLCQKFAKQEYLCNYFYIRFLRHEECIELINNIIKEGEQND